MPLSFNSISHGNIAFGFFNIDSDMLLLERYFFFADQFCEHISNLADPEIKAENPFGPVYHIPRPDAIGDLMGAIHGFRHTGFMGALYRRFPFPENPEAFKQHPDGRKNQALVRETIEKYADMTQIPFITDTDLNVCIGPYRFRRTVFHALVRYVWQGGYPRWLDDIRPDCVMAMRKKIDRPDSRLREIFFEDI